MKTRNSLFQKAAAIKKTIEENFKVKINNPMQVCLRLSEGSFVQEIIINNAILMTFCVSKRKKTFLQHA